AESTVSEVHYLPVTDAMVATASSSPLWEQGRWLVKAAWAAARYKSTQGEGATGNPNARVVDESLTPEELTLQLQKLSQALTVYAKATLMLSEHVSESLKSNQRPDPDVSAELKKAFARLTESTHEALDFISDHPNLVTREDVDALPLDLAGQAQERMAELIEQGFLN